MWIMWWWQATTYKISTTTKKTKMTEEEIINLVVESAKVRKRAIKGIDPVIASAIGRPSAKGDIPDYYPTYREMVEQYRHIEYHADSSIFPEDLFSKRSPNIGAEEENYVRENYKNNTQTVFLDFVNQFSRIFHDSNWSMEFTNDDSQDSLKEYLRFGIMEFGSLENYMKSVATPLKVLDPNGVIAVKPMSFEFEFNEFGEQIIDEETGFAKLKNVPLDPQPVYYRVEQIVDQKFGLYYLILTDEKSYIDYGGKKIKAGLVYEYYDKDYIYKISQKGKPENLEFDINIYLQHNWGWLPVFKFKGVAKVSYGDIYYVSPFFYSVHALDACLLNGANLQTSTDNCAYPYRIMIGDTCEHTIETDGEINKCLGGKIFNPSTGKEIICPACNGTQLKSRLSPLGVMLLKQTGHTEIGDNVTATNAMAFVAPDPAILVFLREQIATDYAKARQVLHLRTQTAQTAGPDPTGNNPTATGEVLDQKAQDSFIKPYSDQMFELYGNIVEAIEWQRYGRMPTFNLSPAKTFDFMSVSDYLKDIADKKAAGLPPSVINAAIQKFIDGSFWNDTIKSKSFNLILLTDRIISMNNDDVAFQISKNLIAPWEEILHESADFFIANLLNENPSFFDQEIDKQKEDLINKAKEKAAELKPVTSTVGVNNIINDIID